MKIQIYYLISQQKKGKRIRLLFEKYKNFNLNQFFVSHSKKKKEGKKAIFN